MITTSKVNFRYGTEAGYLQSNIDQDTIYFLTDVKKIFKGTVDMTSNVIPVSEEFPAVAQAIPDKLYVDVDTFEVRVKLDVGWKILSPGYISDECDWADLSTDDKLVTKRVIKNKILTLIASLDEKVDTILGPGPSGGVVVSGSSGEVIRSDLPLSDIQDAIYWAGIS